MRNKRLLAISAIAISASVFMTACSFGGDGKTDKTETVEVTDTPTPEVTQAPTETPVPTIAPNVQSTTYTSADKSIAINLPDATWANKTDETDMLSFESPEQGNILILHGQGEDTMAATVVPSTQDMQYLWNRQMETKSTEQILRFRNTVPMMSMESVYIAIQQKC